MTHSRDTSFTTTRLVWVGVIAAVAALLTGWLRWDSVPVALGMAIASAVISVAVVWLVDQARRPR